MNPTNFNVEDGMKILPKPEHGCETFIFKTNSGKVCAFAVDHECYAIFMMYDVFDDDPQWERLELDLEKMG